MQLQIELWKPNKYKLQIKPLAALYHKSNQKIYIIIKKLAAKLTHANGSKLPNLRV